MVLIVYILLIFTASSSAFNIPNIPYRNQLTIRNSKAPADIIKELSFTGQPGGEPWTYNDFLTHIQHKDISSISLLTDNNVLNGAIAIDKITPGKELLSENMHLIKTNPLLLDRILQQLEQGRINFDFIDVETHIHII